MRNKEGYRANKYGRAMQGPDKFSIHLALPLDLNTVVHYAISFRSLQGQSLMVGAANVNIELSGDPLFIQEVKRLSHPTPVQRSRRTSVPDAESLRLYNVLRWIKREDKLQSCLSPPSWGDALSTPTSPFVKQLASLSRLQRVRNFRLGCFDVLVKGDMPTSRTPVLMTCCRSTA